MSKLSSFLRQPVLVFLAVVLGLAFTVYCTYRQKYIGGTDWYGYYQEAQLLKQGRVLLPLELPIDAYPAAVPMGYMPFEDRAVPQYPPGYPVLLALAGFLHLEYFVTPLCGLVGCLLMFLIVRDLTEPWTAAVYALLWAFFPIVAYSSTMVMSDIVATVGLLGSYFFYRRQRLFLSAFILGFSLAVRPTNALYLVVFALPLMRDRQLIRYGLYLAVPCAIYGIYNQAVFGLPWRTGYSDIGSDLQPALFGAHLKFYLGQTFWQLGLPVALLCGLGLTRPHRERLFYAAWFVAFLLFYCFWRHGGDRWWWTRFLLPGYIPLFLLSALGFAQLRSWLVAKFPRPLFKTVPTQFALLGLLSLSIFYYIWFGRGQHDLWLKQKGFEHYMVARRIEALVPPGSYVGSLEFGGALVTYSQARPFLSIHEFTDTLAGHVLALGRPTYLIVEPWCRDNLSTKKVFAQFAPVHVTTINMWGGLEVYRLQLPPAKE